MHSDIKITPIRAYSGIQYRSFLPISPRLGGPYTFYRQGSHGYLLKIMPNLTGYKHSKIPYLVRKYRKTIKIWDNSQ